jgi:hypothetical protein
MPLLSKKANQAKEYVVVQFSDNDVDGVTSPVFIKILKSTIASLGGLKKLGKVDGTYKTPSGLTHKYHRDPNGTVWRNVSGQKNGSTYDSTTVVNPMISGNKVTLDLFKTKAVSTRGVGVTSKEIVNTKVSFHVPISVNKQQVADWIAVNFGAVSTVIKQWHFGKSTFFAGSEKKPEDNSLKDAKEYFVPMGSIEVGKANKNGSVAKAGKNDTLAVAVMRSASVLAFGFKKIESSSVAEIEKGTTLPGTAGKNDGGQASRYGVFKDAKCYSQIWTNVSTENTATQTPIAKPGKSLKVKCRFTKRSNSLRAPSKSGGKVKRSVEGKNSYAYFYCAAGTPHGLIHEAISNFPTRPRSFQVATGGGNSYGTSYEIPQKADRTK